MAAPLAARSMGELTPPPPPRPWPRRCHRLPAPSAARRCRPARRPPHAAARRCVGAAAAGSSRSLQSRPSGRRAARRFSSPEQPRKCGTLKAQPRCRATVAKACAYWLCELPSRPWKSTRCGADGCAAGCRVEVVHVDEVAVGCGPAFAHEARRRAEVAARVRGRPDGLQVATRQPARCGVALHRRQCKVEGVSPPPTLGAAAVLRRARAGVVRQPGASPAPSSRTRWWPAPRRSAVPCGPALDAFHQVVQRATQVLQAVHLLGHAPACRRRCRRWLRSWRGWPPAPMTRPPPGCTQTISSSSAQTAIRRSMSPCCSAS
jgi:hypothetical protein